MAFDNPFVSRRHAQIRYSNPDYIIQDLGSKNGTFVDGARLEELPRALVGGEVIELGEGQVLLTFALKTGTVTLANTSSTEVSSQSRTGREYAAMKGVFVDAPTREVYVDGVRIEPPLSRKEFDVLAFLHERRGEACSKDEIAERGWPERSGESVSDQEIGQCVHRIRRRVETDPGAPKYVELVRGYGYRLAVDS